LLSYHSEINTVIIRGQRHQNQPDSITRCRINFTRKESKSAATATETLIALALFRISPQRSNVNSAESSDEQIGEISWQKKPRQEVNPRRSQTSFKSTVGVVGFPLIDRGIASHRPFDPAASYSPMPLASNDESRRISSAWIFHDVVFCDWTVNDSGLERARAFHLLSR